MIKRMFEGTETHLTFTKDYREFLHGDLVPGSKVTLYYDAERLPQLRTPGWLISCCYKFSETDEVNVLPLWSETGNILTKADDAPGGGTMLTGAIDLPSDAQTLILWFVLSDQSSVAYYDSDFGHNYAFPFLVEDIRVTGADVVSTTDAANSEFTATVETASEIEGLVLDYRVTNQGPIAQATTTIGLERTGTAADGWSQWATGPISVPCGAVIVFSVTYDKNGRRYFDDNHHRGYLAPTP